jgi:hypothetical protein
MNGTGIRSRADLDVEGDRLGAEFRLGERTGAWPAKRWSPRLAWGAIVLMLVACGGFLLPVGLTGFGRGISAVLVSDLVVFAVVLMLLPPRSRTDRLYRYVDGVALQAAREAEPMVIRWADLESMTLVIGSGDDDDYLSSCVLRDRSGRTMTVSHAFRAGAEAIAATAEQVLAPGLVPEFVGRYDIGEPVTVGPVTIDHVAITCANTSSAAPDWRVPWAEARGIDIRMHGHRIRVQGAGGRARLAAMDRVPNGFAVRYLIEHAARRAGITVTADDAAWDGETVYVARPTDPATAPGIIAPVLAGPATSPPILAAGPGAPSPGGLSPGGLRRSLFLAGVAVLVIEGTVIGYLFATRNYPPVVTATSSLVTSDTGRTDSVVFTPDGRDLVFSDASSTVGETGVSGGQSASFNGDPYACCAVVSPDGRTVAAIDGGSQVDLWNAATRASKGSLQAAGADLEAIAYSPDGRRLAGPGRYGNIYLWDTATGAQRVLAGPGLVPGEVQAVAFSPDDTTIAVGDSDGDITLWNAATGALRGTVTDPGQARFGQPSGATGVVSLSFARHGSLLAAADGNGNLYLWDTGGRSLVATLSGNDPVTAAALNPAGTLVAGGTSGGETYLWDVATQQQVAVLGDKGGGSVDVLTFGPDGSQLAIGGKSAIALWRITVHSHG